MRKKRKWSVGIGVLAMVGLAFWMRIHVSWLPKKVATVNFVPTRIFFSRDGKRLIVADDQFVPISPQIFNWKNGAIDRSAEAQRKFEGDYDGLKIYPGVWANSDGLVFSSAAGQNTHLGDTASAYYIFGRRTREKPWPFGWSQSRREIYGAGSGEIWIWDWESGELKRRMRYQKYGRGKSAFSPDGKWLLASEEWQGGNSFLRRYDVQSGKMVGTIHQSSAVYGIGYSFGYSPDGRLFWFVHNDVGIVRKEVSFNVCRASDWKYLWSAPCFAPTKWLPDDRIGIVQKDGFTWRDITGHELQHLLGPFQPVEYPGIEVKDWALSPDGNWIYSCERSGIIRRWRAR